MNLPQTLSDHRRSTHGLQPLTLVKYLAIFIAAILLASIFLPASTSEAQGHHFTPGEGGSYSTFCGRPGFPSCSEQGGIQAWVSQISQTNSRRRQCDYLRRHYSHITNIAWHNNQCWERGRNGWQVIPL